jgi:hypothetical protein
MTNINRLYATLLLIRHSLVPAKGAERSPLPATGSGALQIPPQAFAALLPALDRCLQPDGRLELLFEGALAPAAPALLFRLKRNGFSDCKVVCTSAGISLTARR